MFSSCHATDSYYYYKLYTKVPLGACLIVFPPYSLWSLTFSTTIFFHNFLMCDAPFSFLTQQYAANVPRFFLAKKEKPKHNVDNCCYMHKVIMLRGETRTDQIKKEYVNAF